MATIYVNSILYNGTWPCGPYALGKVYAEGILDGVTNASGSTSSGDLRFEGDFSSIINVAGGRTPTFEIITGGLAEIYKAEIYRYSNGTHVGTDTRTFSSNSTHIKAQMSKTLRQLTNDGITDLTFIFYVRQITSYISLTALNSTQNVSVPAATYQSTPENFLKDDSFTIRKFIPNKTAYYDFKTQYTTDGLWENPKPWIGLKINIYGNFLSIGDQNGEYMSLSSLKRNSEMRKIFMEAGQTYYFIISNVKAFDDVSLAQKEIYDIPVYVEQFFYTYFYSTDHSLGEVWSHTEGATYVLSSAKTTTVTASPKAGCRFVCWTNSAGTIISTNSTYTFTPSKNEEQYFAHFEKIVYTVDVTVKPDPSYGSISFNSNGILEPGKYYYQDTVRMTATPSSIRSKFIGWGDASGLLTNDSLGYEFQITENRTFYAQFEDNLYTVKYDVSPGYNAPSSQTEFVGTPITIKNVLNATYRDPSTETGGTIYFEINTPLDSSETGTLEFEATTAINIIHYNFDYWFNKNDENEKYYSNESYDKYTSIELKAYWQPFIHTYGEITFPSGNLEGYYLVGYSKNATSSVPDFGCYPGSTLHVTPETYGDTYYAIWRKNNYTLNIIKDNSDSDIQVWIRDKDNVTLEYSGWKRVQFNTPIGYEVPTYFQYFIESGEQYQFDQTKRSTFLESVSGVIINDQVPSYWDLYLTKESTLVIFSEEIEKKNSIYTGKSKTAKSKGSIKFPHSNLDKQIESIWIGNTQILGNVPNKEYYPYLYHTMADDIFYVGSNESSIQLSDISNKDTKKIIFPKQWTNTGLSLKFTDYLNLNEIKFPNNLIYIYTDVFNGCSQLETIFLPPSIEYIGPSAFENCHNLKRVILTGINLETIQSSAFQNCINLQYLDLQKNPIEHISWNLCDGCKSLKAISIPNTVATIGKEAFNGCESLLNVYYNGTIEQWNSIDIYVTGNDYLFDATIYCKDGIINPKEDN